MTFPAFLSDYLRPLIKRVGWLTLAQVVASLASFVTAVVLGYMLSPEVYGTYKYIISLSLIISAFSLTGASIALIRSVAQGYTGTIYSALSTSFKWSLLSSGLAVLGALYYFFNDNSVLGFSLLIVALFDPFIRTYGLYTSYLNGHKDFKRISLYGMIPDIALASLLIVSAFMSDSVILLVAVYFIVNALLHYVLYKRALVAHVPNSENDVSFMKSNKHLSVMNIFQTGAQHLDKVLVFGWIGAAPLAVYFFATALPEQMRAFFKITNALILPEYASARVTVTNERVLGAVGKALLVIIPLVVIYIVCAPLLFAIFFPQYIESVIYSQVFALSLVGTAVFAILVSVLQAKDELKKLHFVNIASACVQISIVFVFLVIFQNIWSVVYARVLTTVLLPFITWGLGFTTAIEHLEHFRRRIIK